MNTKDWENKLRQEGFSNFFVWRDGPKPASGVMYPPIQFIPPAWALKAASI